MTDANADNRGQDLGAGQWALAGRVSQEGEQSIAFKRDLTAAEVEDLRAKSTLIRRLVDPAGYAKLIDSVRQFERVVRLLTTEFREGRVTPRVRESAGNEWAVVARQAERFITELTEKVEEDFQEGAAERRSFHRASNEFLASDSWRWLQLIGPASPSFVLATDRLEMVDPSKGSDSIGALDLAYGVAGRCQLLLGAFLEIYEERFNEVAAEIRRVTAEVLEGVPTIIHTPLDAESGQPVTDTLTFHDLPADEITVVARAIRRAKDAKRLATEVESIETETSNDSPDEPPPGMARPIDPAEPTAEKEGRAAETVDVAALARRVVAIAPELERAWSAALDAVDLDAVRKGTDTSWRTLLAVVQRQVAASEKELAAAGIETRIPSFPVPPSYLASLDDLPEAEHRWRLMQLAELWAVTRLAEAMGAVTEKSARRVDLASGESESWWETGAFGLVRARVLVLARVFRLTEKAEASLVGKEPQPSFMHEVDEALRAAMMADSRGDAEATVIHCLRGFRARAAHALGSDQPVPDGFLTRLASIPGWEGNAHALQRAETISRSSFGEDRDLAEMIALSELLTMLLADLRQRVSDQTIRSALESGGPIGEA